MQVFTCVTKYAFCDDIAAHLFLFSKGRNWPTAVTRHLHPHGKLACRKGPVLDAYRTFSTYHRRLQAALVILLR